jgi:hypothetical protein
MSRTARRAKAKTLKLAARPLLGAIVDGMSQENLSLSMMTGEFSEGRHLAVLVSLDPELTAAIQILLDDIEHDREEAEGEE